MKPSIKIEQHYTAAQVAERLGFDSSTIHRLMHDDKITYVKIGARYCIPASSIQAYIKSRTVKAKTDKTYKP